MKDQEMLSNFPQSNTIEAPSKSRTKSPKRINKQCNVHWSTYSNKIESMNSEADHIIANLNLDDIKYIC